MSMVLLDQALDQWNSLVGREENDAYKLRRPPSTHAENEAVQSACPAAWREKICEWCFQVVDHCDIDREVVAVALSYFDRYVSYHTAIAETLFQLVAMTSLYLAVKLHSTRKISVSSMSSLSKGHFRVDQILKMEICIIKSLRWHLNPPTSSIYLDVANPLIDASVINKEASYEITELSRYLVELSVCDSFFADKKPSSVAYAAMSVAMETLSTPSKIKRRIGAYQLDKSPHVTAVCARRLRHVYNLAVSTQAEEEEEVPARAGASPTSVLQA